MKKLLLQFAVLISSASCTLYTQSILYDNQYLEKNNYADPNAPYIGEWTAATGPALTAIKIKGTGDVKICLSNQYFGSQPGKMFKENGKIKMISESGVQHELLSSQSEYLLFSVYGKEGKYYSGKTPEVCKDVFDNF